MKLRLLPLIWFCAATAALAQAIERPEDPLGMAVREPRVRVIHTATPELPGSSMHLQTTDPWMAYKRGYSTFQREWRIKDGVFALASEGYAEANANSCAMCHNMPYRSAGFGGNTAAPVGHGRNIPHLFGTGLVEMIGLQIRQDLYARYDLNGNGFIDVPAESTGQQAIVEPVKGEPLSYGSLEDLNGDGSPDLNPLFTVNFVDQSGAVIRQASDGRPATLNTPLVAGYDLSAAIYSASISDHQFPTLRRFSEGVMRSVMGFRIEMTAGGVDDGLNGDAKANDGWAAPSIAGAAQLIVPAPAFAAPEPGNCDHRSSAISAGEIDLLEWYLLNAPRPARMAQSPQTNRGKALMTEIGCTSCHVQNWSLKGQDQLSGHAGDRRFFDLGVTVDRDGTATGRLQMLAEPKSAPSGEIHWQRRFAPAFVTEIYSDFRHHNMGPKFAEYYYSRRADKAFALRMFRTPPLWGVGSTAPYGHDGRSPTLDHVIRRHGGDARHASDAYGTLPQTDRAALIAYLRSLVLYQPDQVLVDMDGDGSISAMLRRDDNALGQERFRPELMFLTPVTYAGRASADSHFSLAITNLDEAYGLTLPGLLDANSDQTPDYLQDSDGPCGAELKN